MQLLRYIWVYASEVISQRHTDITTNAFSSLQLACKIRNPAKDIIINLGDFITIKLSNCLGVNSNLSITDVRTDKVGVKIGASLASGGLLRFRKGVFEAIAILLGLSFFDFIYEGMNAGRGFLSGLKIR